MKHLYKFISLLFLVMICNICKAQNFYITKISNNRITINGLPVVEIKQEQKSFKRTEIIRWPNIDAWIEVYPDIAFRYKDYLGKEHIWAENDRKIIKCVNAKSEIKDRDFFWWIKRNTTSTKGNEDDTFLEYEAYMLNDTIMISDFCCPMSDENRYSIEFLDDENIKHVVFAQPYKDSNSFFFLRKQFEDDGNWEDVSFFELYYNNKKIVEYLTITKVQ